MGTLSICLACLTKQAGLFIFFLYPMIILILRYKLSILKSDNFSIKNFLFFHLFMGLLFVLPFYAYTEYLIHSGRNSSEIGYLLEGIHHGKSYLKRFIDGNASLLKHIGYLKSIVAILLIFLSLYKWRYFRTIFLLIAFPYYIIWALFYSYDVRNLSLSTLYCVIGVAYGMNEICKIFAKRILRAKFLVPILSICLIFFSLLFLSSDNLIKKQNDKLLYIGNSEINLFLYNYFDTRDNKIDTKILTDYQPLAFIPQFKNKTIGFIFNDKNEYLKKLENDKINYILFGTDYVDEEVKIKIEENVKNGKCKPIFNIKNINFMEIIH
jgi:hypothetical protein